MDRRAAKREACQVVAALIIQALEEVPDAGRARSNVYDPAWSDAEAARFTAAMEELSAELLARGSGVS